MKPLKTLLFSILATAVATTALAQTPAKPRANRCFLQRNINGFAAPDDRTLYVRVGVKDVWRLDLTNNCTGLTFRNNLGLEARPASPWICSPLDATVVFRQTGMSQRCPIIGLRQLTPDEIAALPKRDRP